MSPEALEARINLYNIQSFKQIDMYALGLVMWEVMTRCCVTSGEWVVGWVGGGVAGTGHTHQ